MPKLVSVFNFYNEFPDEVQEYFDTCADYVLGGVKFDQAFYFPLDWTVDSFDEDVDSAVIDAYFEVVTFLKARLLHGTTEAYVE